MTMLQKIRTFFNTCVRSISNIRWPYKIWNKDLWERSEQKSVAEQILRGKWDWIGHPQETRGQHHTPSPGLKSAGQEEERQALQQLEERH
jgi:hypothetical protein